MSLETKVDFKGLTRRVIGDAQLAFDRAVSDEVTALVTRTRQGKDVDGNTFAPYSQKYADFKSGKRRQKRGSKANAPFFNSASRSTTPDLTFSGRMLGAITYKTIGRPGELIAEIFFSSTKEAEKARGNLKKRNFFGFAEEQIARIIEKVRNSIK